MSAAQPCMCTGMMARVRAVTAPRSPRDRGTRSSVSTSAKTGTAPTCRTASGVATKLYAGTMTSSPARTPAAASAMASALVPQCVSRQCFAPTKRRELLLERHAPRARTDPRGSRGRARARPRCARRR